MNEELENFSKKKCSFCKQTFYKISKILEKYVCENCKLNTIQALDSIDLRGLPVIQKDENGNPTKVIWVRPEFFPYDSKGVIE
jgi:hypothetical protein